MALPYLTEHQLEQVNISLKAEIAALRAELKEVKAKIALLESKESSAQKIIVGENTDGTVSMSIEESK